MAILSFISFLFCIVDATAERRAFSRFFQTRIVLGLREPIVLEKIFHAFSNRTLDSPRLFKQYKQQARLFNAVAVSCPSGPYA
jgi:hypothetical protein